MRVDVPFACFGFVVTDGIVTASAPITKWARGHRGRDAVHYWKKRGAKVTWIKIEGDTCG